MRVVVGRQVAVKRDLISVRCSHPSETATPLHGPCEKASTYDVHDGVLEKKGRRRWVDCTRERVRVAHSEVRNVREQGVGSVVE